MQFRLIRTVVATAAIFCAPAWLEAQDLSRGRTPAAAVRIAAQSEYFPLDVGNVWTYAVESNIVSSEQVIQVLDSEDIDGVTYYDVEGLVGGRALLRFDSQGRLVEYRRETGTEQLWFDFAAPVGSGWTIDRPELCFATAQIASRSHEVRTPSGTYASGVLVDFGPEANCADAGYDQDVFVAGIGLVERTQITLAGPMTLRLTEARIGRKIVRAESFGFSLRTDKPVYTPNFFPPVLDDDEEPRGDGIPTLRAVLTLENTTGTPIELAFSDGQRFEVVIRDQRGEEVWRWSDGKAFTQAAGTIRFEGMRTWAVEARLANDADEPWTPGVYTVEAMITNAGERRFTATVGIEVTEPVY